MILGENYLRQKVRNFFLNFIATNCNTHYQIPYKYTLNTLTKLVNYFCSSFTGNFTQKRMHKCDKWELTTKYGMLRATNLHQPRKFDTNAACDACENLKGLFKSFGNMLHRWILFIGGVASGVGFFSFRITGTR